jgi:hypothetical protein
VSARVVLVALVALLAALVLDAAALIPVSLALLGSVYATQLYADDLALDGAAALFAAGLYVIAELAYWSLEERGNIRAEPGESLRRLAVLALLGLVALVVSAALLTLADLVRARGLALDLLGAAAAAAALVAVALAARERGRT